MISVWLPKPGARSQEPGLFRESRSRRTYLEEAGVGITLKTAPLSREPEAGSRTFLEKARAGKRNF